MFDYLDYDSEQTIVDECKSLSPKLLRWLASNHPDNRTRKIFLNLTNVRIGEGTVINAGFVVSDDYLPLLTIGERVAISPNVTVVCISSPNNSKLSQIKGVSEKYITNLPVSIGDDTWLGAGVIILPGVKIGKSCIVGAGAIVTKHVEDFNVVVGNPARKIKKILFDKID
jgi:acetyltransferase-like isoleucine patch superfamily enzyme